MASASSSRRRALPGRGSVILLVDSHDDSRDMYADYLRTCGFRVQTANTTDEALRHASDADVVVTEIRVHGSFDGVDLVGRLREGDETKETPIIVLTACAFDTDQQRARTAGCNVFLPKPCLPERLVSEIRAVGATTLGE
jgi:two-component system cell cycle response regulator DivK